MNPLAEVISDVVKGAKDSREAQEQLREYIPEENTCSVLETNNHFIVNVTMASEKDAPHTVLCKRE